MANAKRESIEQVKLDAAELTRDRIYEDLKESREANRAAHAAARGESVKKSADKEEKDK